MQKLWRIQQSLKAKLLHFFIRPNIEKKKKREISLTTSGTWGFSRKGFVIWSLESFQHQVNPIGQLCPWGSRFQMVPASSGSFHSCFSIGKSSCSDTKPQFLEVYRPQMNETGVVFIFFVNHCQYTYIIPWLVSTPYPQTLWLMNSWGYPQKVLLFLQDHSRKPNWFVSPLANQLQFVGAIPMKNDRVWVIIPYNWLMMRSYLPKKVILCPQFFYFPCLLQFGLAIHDGISNASPLLAKFANFHMEKMVMNPWIRVYHCTVSPMDETKKVRVELPMPKPYLQSGD